MIKINETCEYSLRHMKLIKLNYMKLRDSQKVKILDIIKWVLEIFLQSLFVEGGSPITSNNAPYIPVPNVA